MQVNIQINCDQNQSDIYTLSSNVKLTKPLIYEIEALTSVVIKQNDFDLIPQIQNDAEELYVYKLKLIATQ